MSAEGRAVASAHESHWHGGEVKGRVDRCPGCADAPDRDAVPPPAPSMRSLYSDASRALADLRAARGALVSYALNRGDTANACAVVEEARTRSMRAIDRLAPLVESKARAGKLYELRGGLACYDVTPTRIETWIAALNEWAKATLFECGGCENALAEHNKEDAATCAEIAAEVEADTLEALS